MAKASDTVIPNELFRYELEQRHWTEKYVAEKIGAPEREGSKMIGRWKRGIATPTKFYRPKVEALFGKSMKQLGWAGKNEVSNWKLDDTPNPLFTGREDILNWLHDGLASRGTGISLPIQAFTGLAGVGKSQAAIEYAHKYKHEYHTIIWLRASNKEVLAADFAAIASHIGLDLPEVAKTDQKKQIDAVKAWLYNDEISRWLLIFDSADDPAIINDIVHRYVPELRQGHVIITTRSSATGLIEHRKEVDPLSVEESVHFLLRRTKKSPSDANITLAKAIAEELGGLPLALEQAGAYIEKTGCGLAHYLDLYQTAARKRLLAYKGKLTDYPYNPIAVTLRLTYQQVKQVNPLAFDLLSLFAFYAPDHIPEELVRECSSVLSPALQTLAKHPELLENAMGELMMYSLIRRYPDTKTCSIHLLVQTCMKDTMDEKTQQLWAARAIKAINQTAQTAPGVDSFIWSGFARYFSHAQKCLDHIRQWSMTSTEAAELISMTGLYLLEQAKYDQASGLLHDAYKLNTMNFGQDHLEVAKALNNLASVYIKQLNYSIAEAMYLTALKIRVRVLGSMNREVSQSMNNLAVCYQHSHLNKRAEYLFKQSININNTILAANDPEKRIPLTNLATLYTDLGRYSDAKPLFKQAIEIIEHAGMKDNVATSDTYALLAAFYRDQGMDTEAESIYLHVIAINEKALGREHPHVAVLYSKLGYIYIKLQKYAEAEELLLKARKIHENALGIYHPDTAHILSNLGYLYHIQGRDEDAESLRQMVRTILSEPLVVDHLDVAWDLWAIARMYIARNRLLEAKQTYEQALDTFDEIFAVKDPNVISIRMEYTTLLKELEMYDEAKEQAKILGISLRTLLFSTPSTDFRKLRIIFRRRILSQIEED